MISTRFFQPEQSKKKKKPTSTFFTREDQARANGAEVDRVERPLGGMFRGVAAAERRSQKVSNTSNFIRFIRMYSVCIAFLSYRRRMETPPLRVQATRSETERQLSLASLTVYLREERCLSTTPARSFPETGPAARSAAQDTTRSDASQSG